jgi:2-oxoisovalerate dehydrogenase E1 component
MLQLLAKKDDPFSGGRSYYCHPSNKNINPVHHSPEQRHGYAGDTLQRVLRRVFNLLERTKSPLLKKTGKW